MSGPTEVLCAGIVVADHVDPCIPHVAGQDERAIAQELFLTPHSVRTTVRSLRERFGDDLAALLDGSSRFAG